MGLDKEQNLRIAIEYLGEYLNLREDLPKEWLKLSMHVLKVREGCVQMTSPSLVTVNTDKHSYPEKNDDIVTIYEFNKR